jgi:hypothetical protein
LTKLGLLKRLDRVQGGYGGGSGEYVYQLPTSKARTPDPHTLDVAELYVRLMELGADVIYEPEPYSHTRIGHVELKPDATALLTINGKKYDYWIEVDLASEWRTQLSAKMKRYVKAYEAFTGEVFPLCLWTVPDKARAVFVKSVIDRQKYPELFDVVTFDDAPKRLIEEW